MIAFLGQIDGRRIGGRQRGQRGRQAPLPGRAQIGHLPLRHHGLVARPAASAIEQFGGGGQRRLVGHRSAEQIAPRHVGIEQRHHFVQPRLGEAGNGGHVDIVRTVLALHRRIARLAFDLVQPGQGVVIEAQPQVDLLDTGIIARNRRQAGPHRKRHGQIARHFRKGLRLDPGAQLHLKLRELVLHLGDDGKTGREREHRLIDDHDALLLKSTKTACRAVP